MAGKKNISKESQTSAVDWRNIHSRLDAVVERLEKGWNVTEQEKEQILRARSRALAGKLKDRPLRQEYL